MRRFVEKVFIVVSPIFRPVVMQNMLRALRIPLPYFLAKHLKYSGVVSFELRGQKLRMRSHNTPIEITLFWKGLFKGREGDELKFWSELITDADVVLDIGANNGIYSLVASTNKSAHVYAFEPVPLVFNMLQENIQLSERDNITPKQLVIGDHTGVTNLHIPYGGWVDIASLDANFIATRSKDDAHSISCDMITVDDFLEQEEVELGARVLCKIDVEGAEERVLKGMVQTLAKRPVSFVIEILNEKYFNELTNILPGNYTIFTIGSTVKETLKYNPSVKNYYCKRK